MIERLRIAQVSPLHERVPPSLYGGTERVVAFLTDELLRRGHDVTVFASGDSETRAKLIAPVPRALRLDLEATDSLSPHIVELAQVFDRADEFDVIHCHVDYLAFPFGRFVRTPTLHTLHGRLDLPHLVPVFHQFRDVPVVSGRGLVLLEGPGNHGLAHRRVHRPGVGLPHGRTPVRRPVQAASRPART